MTAKTVKKKAAPKKKSAKSNISKKTEKADKLSLQIVATAKCQTISGKSTITYNLGADNKNALFIRIKGNTGGGFYSDEWIPLNNITAVLDELPADQPISSINLFPLFNGKSVNTPGYLLASLLSEGVLSLAQGKKRVYHYSGTDKLLAKLQKKLK